MNSNIYLKCVCHLFTNFLLPLPQNIYLKKKYTVNKYGKKEIWNWGGG